jgi:hypothetical protein
MTDKEFLIAFFGATLQRDSDAVASLLNEDGSIKEDALTTAKNWHAEHLKATRDRDGKTFDNGYKKAQSEVADKIEKRWKEVVGIDSDLKGDELIEAAKAKLTEQPTPASTLNDEAVKKHPAYVTREKELMKQVAAANEAKTAEIEKLQKDYTRKESLAKVYDKAETLFKTKNPILPADEAKAKRTIKSLLLEPLGGYDYEINEQGEIVSITKEGKRLEDGNGNPVSFENLVLQKAQESFEFKEHKEKQSAQGQGAQGTGAKPVVIPKTKEEYAKIISDTKIPIEERTAIQDAWKQSQAATV